MYLTVYETIVSVQNRNEIKIYICLVLLPCHLEHQGLFNNSSLHSTFLVATWSGINCSTGSKNGKCLSRSAKL